MRTSFAALLSFVASTVAYQVTYPSASDVWYAEAVRSLLARMFPDTDCQKTSRLLTSLLGAALTPTPPSSPWFW